MDPAAEPAAEPAAPPGRIQLQAGAVQAVFRGRRACAYRLGCEQGRIEVRVDGEPVGLLDPGQSLDVEGTAVDVCAAGAPGDAAVRGSYGRLA